MRPVSELVLKYLGGLAIGAAVIGGYAGLRHVMRDEPAILPSRATALETIAPVASVAPVEIIAPVEPAPYAETPDKPAEASEIPTTCREYFRLIERYAECKEVPEATRGELRHAIDGIRASFGELKDLSEDARAEMTNGCEQAADAILESGKTMGCEM